ncbi:MAG: DsrE family protein [Xenococcus sp. MO_188.B8]|nr:DsrE family protein [Xenococcus sp. MO_188.B8]
MKALQILQSAYRCTVEEQDDPALWFVQVLKTAQGDVDIVLKNNAVNYAVVSQDASGLSFGNWKQSQPSQLNQDLQQAIDQGITIYVIAEDIAVRGISDEKLLPGIQKISRLEMSNLFNNYDQVWTW